MYSRLVGRKACRWLQYFEGGARTFAEESLFLASLVGERIAPSRSFQACCLRLFLIRSASLRWLMKTVEYDSYAALTASYFASLPLASDLRRSFLRRVRLFSDIGVVISWICQTRNIRRESAKCLMKIQNRSICDIFSLYYPFYIYIFFYNWPSINSSQIT